MTNLPVIGILPAAGLATRMRGLPKFLLPVSNKVQTLLEYHIEAMSPFVESIIVPTSIENRDLVERYVKHEKVEVLSITSDTMTETVIQSLREKHWSSCILGMPDTFFQGSSPYSQLSTATSDLCLALWKTSDEQQGQVGGIEIDINGDVTNSFDKDPTSRSNYHWGAMKFSNSLFSKFADSDMPHVGYIIQPAVESKLQVTGFVVEGNYFDCGIFSEYKRCIENI